MVAWAILPSPPSFSKSFSSTTSASDLVRLNKRMRDLGLVVVVAGECIYRQRNGQQLHRSHMVPWLDQVRVCYQLQSSSVSG